MQHKARRIGRRLADAAIRERNATLEQKVAERTAALENANRELEAYAYSVSHDLRAPLRTIRGYAELIEEDFAGRLPEDARGYLARIRTATQRMGGLIDSLLAFSRFGRQALDVQDVEVAPVVEAALDDLASERNGRAVEIVQGELGRARADRALLSEVFLNLIDNALKYTRARAPARIEIASQAENGHRIWFVRDNGVGFDMKHAEEVFGIFQRLHHEQEFDGNGIGLALVQRIVERHGGRVWAESTPGSGATVYFTLQG